MKSSNQLFILFFILLIFSSTVGFTQNNTFENYKIKEFNFEGRTAKIVFPEEANDARNWVWRARFWGHEPQTDLALLEKGFHVVYVDVAGLYGSPKAVAVWNGFYDFITTEYKLNNKAVLEGMSRGGLIIYNWAAENTNKVFCMYADAPVCDIKSWPGGLYKGKGSVKSWDECLAVYGLNEKSVKRFKASPINNSKKVAKAGIPVIHVCGAADKVVPLDENTLKLAKKFRKAGGEMKLITKEGVGHHPHSLEDPQPIVDFIMNHINEIKN